MQKDALSVRVLQATEAAMTLNTEALHLVDPGISLLQADNFEKWLFTIEVMGDSLYVVGILASLFRTVQNYILTRSWWHILPLVG